MEITSTAGILLISWIILTILDVAISGMAALIFRTAFRKVFLWGLLSLAVPPVLMAYGILIERNIFVVKDVEVTFEDLPTEFDGYRIVHLSDIHARSFEKRERSLRRAVKKINRQEADLIAFTGDLVTLSPDELDNLSGILGGLHAEDGIVSVLGNHDYGIYAHGETGIAPEKAVEDLMMRQKTMGWDIPVNDSRIIRRGKDSVAVVGVENTSVSSHFPSRGDLCRASEGTEGVFRILLSHDPTHWEMEILGKDYPLTLSGHTHAMQFSIFGWSPSRFIFRQNKGLYSNGRQYIYVNTGLGETIFPARIGTPPEITVITLKRV